MISETHYVLYGSVGTVETVHKGLDFFLDSATGYNIIRINALHIFFAGLRQ